MPVSLTQQRCVYDFNQSSFSQGYILAQVLGGLVGAALVYANYFHAIDIFEGGRGIRTLSTASLFSTYAVSNFSNLA